MANEFKPVEQTALRRAYEHVSNVYATATSLTDKEREHLWEAASLIKEALKELDGLEQRVDAAVARLFRLEQQR